MINFPNIKTLLQEAHAQCQVYYDVLVSDKTLSLDID